MKRIHLVLAAIAIAIVAGVAYATDVSLTLHGSCTNTEFLVTNSAGGSTLAIQTGRRSMYIQNNGPNPIWCRLDGGVPVTNSSGGWQIAAGASWPGEAGDVISLKCIAATAAQVTTVATSVLQCR